MTKTDKSAKKFYDLDTSAKIYPYIATKDWNQTFRVSVVLNETVQPTILKQAVKLLVKRFPSMYVRLKACYNWYRLVPSTDNDIVYPDRGIVCRPFDLQNDRKPLIRVLYSQKRISAEFFHSVADGLSGMVYLKTLVAAYYELLGVSVTLDEETLSPTDEPKDSETEDSFQRYYAPEAGFGARKESLAYQYVPEKKDNRVRLTTCLMDVESLKAAAKNYGATITHFLVATYIYAFFLNKKSDMPIKIEVPINMRKMFPSTSLRNFSLYVNIELDESDPDVTFDEILADTIKQFKEKINKDAMQQIINTNVRDSRMLLTKILPHFLKFPILKVGSVLYGERLFTSPFSNLGTVSVPEELREHISYFQSIIGLTKLNNIYGCVAGFNGKLCVSLTSNSDEMLIQNCFVDFLRSHDVKVDVTVE